MSALFFKIYVMFMASCICTSQMICCIYLAFPPMLSANFSGLAVVQIKVELKELISASLFLLDQFPGERQYYILVSSQ